ncbi:MAG: hypothetical protein D6803_07070 [Anaerolineae bacterium]|nr:MAG: hypothetical protein D6803_07070 [Anaerolineae bacterium]
MRTWELSAADPGAYTLAADARCGPVDYTNDAIWELSLRTGEPPAITLHTTLGLRLRGLRLFPRFSDENGELSDPNRFALPPRVATFFPNYLRVNCAPYEGMATTLEYWTPDSHTVCGRITLANNRLTERIFTLEWVGMLTDAEGHNRFLPRQIESTDTLCAEFSDNCLLLMLSGGPQAVSSPQPALKSALVLKPGTTHTLTWALTQNASPEAALERGREVLALPWEKHIAALEALNGGQLEIETGDPDWDAAFALAQKTAFGLLMSAPNAALPHLSFVSSRHPDQGYSLKGDGSDYVSSWRGQSVLETEFLIGQLLPSAPQICLGLLENFLAASGEDGFVDHQPGLVGQRSGWLAAPFLTALAWEIYQYTQDDEALRRVYPPLRAYLHRWFDRENDRDQDGFPEWTHPRQIGLEEHISFGDGRPRGEEEPLTWVETPALAALLLREIQALTAIQGALDLPPDEDLLRHARELRQHLAALWDEQNACFARRDRETHLRQRGERIGQLQGPGELTLERDFPQPVRLLLRLQGEDTSPRAAEIYLHGLNLKGQPRMEKFVSGRAGWLTPTLAFLSHRTYLRVERVDVRGVGAADRLQIEVADLSAPDISDFLPLLSEGGASERIRQMVDETLLNADRFWKRYGLPLALPPSDSEENTLSMTTSALWCSLIGRGLVQRGYRQQAAQLLTRLMDAIVRQLKGQKAFSQYYHAIEGRGAGQRHALSGLAPQRFFLETLGVRILSPQRVVLEGQNPFPWPVTLRFRGLVIRREADKTRLTFPGGQTAVIKDPRPTLIELENPNHASESNAQTPAADSHA